MTRNVISSPDILTSHTPSTANQHRTSGPMYEIDANDPTQTSARFHLVGRSVRLDSVGLVGNRS